MAKKAVKKAKKAKKTTKKSVNSKTVKKRKTNKKVVRKRTKAKKSVSATKTTRFYLHKHAPRFNLHAIKLKIKSEVPMMPCTVIAKDRHGRLFAHTQAEKVFNILKDKCDDNRLVIRRERGNEYDAECPSLERINNEWKVIKVPCVRYAGQWEICHQPTGEHEYFEGAGDGDNDIWSICSAQTVAKKCALLDYFEFPWPQPTDWLKTVRESMEELPPQELFKAIKGVIPPAIFEATKIGDLLTDYFNGVLKTHNEGKTK